MTAAVADAVLRRIVAARPALLEDRSTHYCPGCGHGVVHRLVAEVLDELGLGQRTIAVAPVGCAVFAYDYLDIDFVEAPHGRAPAVATGVRRVQPGCVRPHLSGRRRPGGDRHGGDRPCGRPRRAHHRRSSSTTASTA